MPPTDSAAPTARVARVVCRILRKGFFIGLRSVILCERNPKRRWVGCYCPRALFPEHFSRKSFNSSIFHAPGQRRQTSLDAGLSEEGVAFPSIFCSDLRQ